MKQTPNLPWFHLVCFQTYGINLKLIYFLNYKETTLSSINAMAILGLIGKGPGINIAIDIQMTTVQKNIIINWCTNRFTLETRNPIIMFGSPTCCEGQHNELQSNAVTTPYNDPHSPTRSRDGLFVTGAYGQSASGSVACCMCACLCLCTCAYITGGNQLLFAASVDAHAPFNLLCCSSSRFQSAAVLIATAWQRRPGRPARESHVLHWST